jgi:hypothetical protein
MLENEGATPDGIEVEEVDEKSMDDTIRETLAKLTAGESAEPVEAEKPAITRDDSGRFAPRQEAQEEVQPEVPEAPSIPPPNTWRKEVAEKWAAVPPEVQQEVLRREQDFHKGIEQYRQEAQFGGSMRQALEPFIPTMQALGVTPDVAVQNLLQADAKLRFGSPDEKVQFLGFLAQQYGVDIGKVQEYKPAPVDPTLSALQQQMRQLQGYIEQQQNLGRQQAEETLHSEISRFAADPAHVHFEAVREHMAALLQAGLATSLDDAYAQAIYANPQTRQALTQQQAQAQREEAAKKAEAAKRMASVNVRSRPALPADIAAGQTMDDTIRETLRRLTSA